LNLFFGSILLFMYGSVDDLEVVLGPPVAEEDAEDFDF
jgi:hypothetical protein